MRNSPVALPQSKDALQGNKGAMQRFSDSLRQSSVALPVGNAEQIPISASQTESIFHTNPIEYLVSSQYLYYGKFSDALADG